MALNPIPKVLSLTELLEGVLTELSPFELVRAQLVCKTWYSCIQHSTTLRRTAWISSSGLPTSFTIKRDERPDVDTGRSYIDHEHIHPLLVAKMKGFIQYGFSSGVPAAVLFGDNQEELILITSSISFLMSFESNAYTWLICAEDRNWLMQSLTRPSVKSMKFCFLNRSESGPYDGAAHKVVKLNVDDAINMKDFMTIILFIGCLRRMFPTEEARHTFTREALYSILRSYLPKVR